MKIAYLGAGAAGRYCGACLHDNTLATALGKLGEEILLIPTYTPLRTDEENVSYSRVFFGGVNVYLQQKSALFRHTPWFVDAVFDSPRLLAWLSRKSSGMEARQLGELTISTLQGEHGRQRKELNKLVHWMAGDFKPDVVHVSNSMLAGSARQIRQRLGVPIVCGLAGEDIFLEGLTEPHYSEARRLLKERARDIDAFVALNDYYADFMAEYLEVPRSRIDVIRHGLNLAGHGKRPPREGRADPTTTIGYFARVAPEKGLHLLIEAFSLLCEDQTLPPLRLRVAGYKSAADDPYYEALVRRAEQLGLANRFEYAGELDRAEKIAFLQSLDLMAVPTVYHESKGISVLEAWANAVPVVLPAHGTFPEYIEDTGGGLLCEPENPRSLADKLGDLIRNSALADELGLRGHAAIHERYTAETMAAAHRDLYRRIVRGPRVGVQAVGVQASACPETS
ncbi:MAG: glycosyltransferase family 4 protein [Pirellulales bacterium]